MLVPVFMQLLISLKFDFLADYSLSFVIRFVAAYTLIALFSYLFERTREMNQKELDLINQSLENLVVLQTKELVELNKELNKDITKGKK